MRIELLNPNFVYLIRDGDINGDVDSPHGSLDLSLNATLVLKIITANVIAQMCIFEPLRVSRAGEGRTSEFLRAQFCPNVGLNLRLNSRKLQIEATV